MVSDRDRFFDAHVISFQVEEASDDDEEEDDGKVTTEVCLHRFNGQKKV